VTFLGQWAFLSMTAVAGSITEEDVDEFARTYARPGGWSGAVGLYRSMLTKGDQIKALVKAQLLTAPHPGHRGRWRPVHLRHRQPGDTRRGHLHST
jgi:hypothetical protein